MTTHAIQGLGGHGTQEAVGPGQGTQILLLRTSLLLTVLIAIAIHDCFINELSSEFCNL